MASRPNSCHVGASIRVFMLEMTTSPPPPATEPSDADLVALSRAGHREAFGQIVARYQSLVCSLAYSAVGSVAQSEDLAQETFVAAWRHLPDLREPVKLRAWLCEIARNRIHHWRRQQGREPTHAAEALESAAPLAAPEPSPSALAIQRDEETILWREMEHIPEIYREPLILFYRQNQSIANVAAALDLSEDAVKQRLSRGRKLLQEQVLAFVEGTLARTNPGPAFTSQVMAALPITAGGAIKSASVATAAAKAATAAKATGILGWLGLLVWPLIVLLAGLSTIIDDSIQNAFPKGREKAWVEKTGFGKQLIMAMLSFVWFLAFFGLALWLFSKSTHDFNAFFMVGMVCTAVSMAGLKVWNRPAPWTMKAVLALSAKQAASVTVFMLLAAIVYDYQKSTLILLGLTLAGLIFVKLARLGDPDRCKIVVRAAGWVACLMFISTLVRWPEHSVLFHGAVVALCLGFIIMRAIIRPRTRTPPDSTV